MKQTTNFSKKDIFDNNIKPQIESLIVNCRKEGFPLFISACYENDESNSKYFSTIVSPKLLNITLSNDYLAEYLKVARGYKTSLDNDSYIGKTQDDDFFSAVQEMSNLVDEEEIVKIKTTSDDGTLDLYEK